MSQEAFCYVCFLIGGEESCILCSGRMCFNIAHGTYQETLVVSYDIGEQINGAQISGEAFACDGCDAGGTDI